MDMQNQTPNPIPPQIPPQPPARRRSIVGPVILIALGVAFLLSNLGLFTWNIWELMWRLWPLWLVAAGLDLLIGRRTSWGSWVVLGLTLALIGSAGWFMQESWSGTTGEVMRAETFSQPLSGARRGDVTIHTSVGQLTVRESTNPSVLAEGQIQPLGGERVAHDFNLSGDTARLTLESRGEHIGPFFKMDRGSGRWDVLLNPQVPMSLRIETGVGKSEIDLARVQVTDLRLETGVGETTITLPQQGQLRARVDSVVGAVTIRVPRGMAARVTAENGIGNVSINGDYDRQGSTYLSRDYQSAPNRVDLEVHGGVGAIRVEEFTP